MAAWVAVAGATAVAVTLLLPKEYESDASLLLETSPTADQALVLEALGWFNRARQSDTEVQLLESRRVSELAVEALGLHARVTDGELEGFASDMLPTLQVAREASPGTYRLQRNGGFWTLTSDDVVAPLGQAAPGERIAANGLEFTGPERPEVASFALEVIPFGEAVEELHDRVEVSSATISGELLEVRCTGPNPTSAQLLCSELTNSYIGLRTDLQRAEATATADFLLGQSDLIRQRLDAAEDSLEAYSRRNQAAALGERANQEVRQITELTAQRQALSAERTALSEMIRRVEAGGREEGDYRNLASFPTLLRNPVVTDLVSTLIELETRRSDLAVLRQPEDAELSQLSTRIEDVEGQLRDFALQYEAGLGAQIRALESASLESTTRIESLPVQQVAVARLEREARLLQELYELLETRRREAELARAIELPAVEVLDTASLPLEPSAPNLLRNLILALLAALLLGGAHGLTREMLDGRVHDSGRLEREVGVSVLAGIPTGAGDQVLFGATRVDRRLESRADLAEETFRGLVTDLDHFLRRAQDQPLRSLAVVSPGLGNDGRAVAACNIAMARLSNGLPCALIDADLRRGGASEALGFTDAPGLSEVLSGDARLSEVVRYATSPVAGEAGFSLALLPSGRPASDAGELVRRRLLRDVILSMTNRHRFVVVNTPAAAVATDAYAISSAVDGVVVVARLGVTDRTTLQETVDRLRRVGARIVGVVLLDADSPDTAPRLTAISTGTGVFV